MIAGMGHDLPKENWPEVLGGLIAHVKSAERERSLGCPRR